MKKFILIIAAVLLTFTAATAQRSGSINKAVAGYSDSDQQAVYIAGNMLHAQTPTDFLYPIYMYNVQTGYRWLFTPRGIETVDLANMPSGLWVVYAGGQVPGGPWFNSFKWYKP